MPSLIEQGAKIGNRLMLVPALEHIQLGRTQWANAQTKREQSSAREVLVDGHLKLSTAFTPLLFALLGIPLGLAVRKGSRAAALGGAVMIALVGYYPLVMLAGALAANGALAPVVAAWMPNVALALPGAWLFNHYVIRA